MDKDAAFNALKTSLDEYAPISEVTWQKFKSICQLKQLKKGESLYQIGVTPKSFSYVFKGLMRCFVYDDKGNEYNKMFFDEGKFPGSMTALLTSTPSFLAFEAIETTILVEINFAEYRQLMLANDEIKLFQIYYLEKNWLLAKDAREIEIVQQDATTRYLKFVEQFPTIVKRIPQYHIASHLGITPTQLSRVRKNLVHQPM